MQTDDVYNFIAPRSNTGGGGSTNPPRPSLAHTDAFFTPADSDDPSEEVRASETAHVAVCVCMCVLGTGLARPTHI